MTETSQHTMDQSDPGDATRDAFQVARLAELLDAEPVFHASLGSKELFHSNLIAWFVDHHAAAARQVFASWTHAQPTAPARPTERERRHLDLVIHLEGAGALIIENKVFSPPRDEQLVAYAQEVAQRYGSAPAFVLLSLSAPGWPGGERLLGGQLWRHRSYGDLGAAITAASGLVQDGYARQTIEHYAVVTDALQELASIVATQVSDAMPFALPDPLAAPLRRIRLIAGFEKLRTRSIAHYIEDHLAQQHLSDVRVVDGYTRTWPLLESFTRVTGTDVEIGWQYQEGQFRLAVRLSREHDLYGTGPAKKENREKYVVDHYNSWFNFTDVDAILGTAVPTAPHLAVCKHFAPDFVYLYRPARNLTVQQLRALAETTAQRAHAFNSER
jgi:hypothetical protein